MSARKRKDEGLVTLDELVAEAKESDKGSFRLQIAVDDVIEIPRPDTDSALELEEIMRDGTSREFLQELAGDDYDRLMKAIGSKDAEVLKGFARRIQKHFGLGE